MTSSPTDSAAAPRPASAPALPAARFLDRMTPPHVATLVLLAGISALSQSVFLPSLAHMAEYFGANYAVMQLAVSGYLAATALIQLAIGPLADRFGRRVVTLTGLALFCLATLGALLSTSIGWFLAFRMMQAVVATGMVLSRAMVRDMVPQDQAAAMIGYVTMGVALIPMVGPVIGGALDAVFGWRGGFALLLAGGIITLALAWADQGETMAARGGGFRAQFRQYPALLRSPRFWGYVACLAFGSGAFFALLGGASFIANQIYGLSALWAGAALGSPAIGYLFGNWISARQSVRYGVDRMALAGTVISSLGMALSLALGLFGVDGPWAFFGCCIFLGVGNGMMLPNATAGSLSVRPELAGTASGLGGAIMIGGGAVMAALAGSLLRVETGALPLQLMMLGCSVAAGVAILMVMRRARRLGI